MCEDDFVKKFRFSRTDRKKPSRVLTHAEERARLDSIPTRVARLRAEGETEAADILEKRALKEFIKANSRTIKERIKLGNRVGDLAEVNESMRRRLTLLEAKKQLIPAEGQK